MWIITGFSALALGFIGGYLYRNQKVKELLKQAGSEIKKEIKEL